MAEDSLETSSLIFSENEKVFMNVVCCSCDRVKMKMIRKGAAAEACSTVWALSRQ